MTRALSIIRPIARHGVFARPVHNITQRDYIIKLEEQISYAVQNKRREVEFEWNKAIPEGEHKDAVLATLATHGITHNIFYDNITNTTKVLLGFPTHVLNQRIKTQPSSGSNDWFEDILRLGRRKLSSMRNLFEDPLKDIFAKHELTKNEGIYTRILRKIYAAIIDDCNLIYLTQEGNSSALDPDFLSALLDFNWECTQHYSLADKRTSWTIGCSKKSQHNHQPATMENEMLVKRVIEKAQNKVAKDYELVVETLLLPIQTGEAEETSMDTNGIAPAALHDIQQSLELIDSPISFQPYGSKITATTINDEECRFGKKGP